MTVTAMIAIASLGLTAGIMIGCIGIGGVVLVPALTYLGGIPIQTAIAAAMMAYMLSGIWATVVFAREQVEQKALAIWLWAGAMPAALAGAWAANQLHPLFLELVIGLLILFSGFHSFRQRVQVEQQNRQFGGPMMAALGSATGFASSMTGTGGPLVLVPMLMALRVPVLTAIRLGQSAQFPIALLATFGNFLYGDPDIILGSVLMLGVTVGSMIGTRLSQILPRRVLRRIVSLALIATAIAIFIKIIQHVSAP